MLLHSRRRKVRPLISILPFNCPGAIGARSIGDLRDLSKIRFNRSMEAVPRWITLIAQPRAIIGQARIPR